MSATLTNWSLKIEQIYKLRTSNSFISKFYERNKIYKIRVVQGSKERGTEHTQVFEYRRDATDAAIRSILEI